MDVILHVGAHRCATTTFQHYLRRNSERLNTDGIGVWEPRRTRNGLFHGILPGPQADVRGSRYRRGVGRVRVNLALAAERFRNLIVSDENMLGTMGQNQRSASLYGAAGDRMARFFPAFEGHVSDVILNIRSQETYWASVFGYGLMRGRPMPEPEMLERLSHDQRSWRDVITDLACALPGVRLWVLPFETFAGRPDAQLATLVPGKAPRQHARIRVNATARLQELRADIAPREAARLPEGEGRFQPFTRCQIVRLRERYADDVMWLMSGADGLAWMMDDPEKRWTGLNPSSTDMTRGRSHDERQGRMEGTG